MQINIQKVDKELIDSNSVPVAAYFTTETQNFLDHNGIYYTDNNNGYPYKLTKDGELYFKNNRVTQRKNKLIVPENPKAFENLGDYPIRLFSEDSPFLEEVVLHWNDIKNNFVKIVSSGQSMIGHISTSYHFPCGTKKVWYNKEFRKEHKESLEDFLEVVRGASFDERFTSEFCEYIEGVPSKQHYKNGRFDYYLENDSISIEDDKTIQKISNPDEIIELLKFIAKDKNNALKRLIGN